MAMILANKNQTRSNKKNINVLNCFLSRKKREKSNYKKIHNWSRLMQVAPTLFKGSKKIIIDKKCGNIYVFFNGGHLSLHYLYKTKTGCKCWTKRSNSKRSNSKRSNSNKRSKNTRKNKSSGSNIHYKIDDKINSPIYIPIFVKREKFTYDNKINISSYHKKCLDWIIDKLNTYSSNASSTA
jgi:hypothetical protein